MNPSASGLEAAYNCPASIVFPHSRDTGPDAENGHALHEVMANLLGGMPRIEAIARAPLHLQKRAENMKREELVGDLVGKVRSEVAYALNVVTDEVRELGVGINRAYPKDLSDDWMVGTLDIEGTRLDGTWTVKDLKTGFLDVTPAAGNFQILFFGRVLWLLHGGSRVEGQVLRMRPDGTCFVESRSSYKPIDLDRFGESLLDIRKGIAVVREAQALGGPLWTSEGSWCKYCPAFSACPAKQGLVRRLVPELDALGETIATMTVDQAGVAWAKYRQIKQVFEVVEKALKERATREPLPLVEGKWARAISYAREGFDQAAAVAMLRDKGATEAELATLRKSTDVVQVRETNAEKPAKKKRGAA